MKSITQLFRLLYINFVLLKHGLDEIVFEMRLFRGLRFLAFLSPARLFRKELPPRGYRIRAALEELGPIFIKFGQVLSTRADILPEDIANELSYLQDRVPPFSGPLAKTLIEKSLKKPITDIFQQFDIEPLASASIAQVHAATLQEGEAVVVKVLRPNIRRHIQRDIALLRTLAHLAQKYWKASRQFKPKEVVLEFEKTLLDEIDLTKEAANASQLKRNFSHSSLLHIPRIHWHLTTESVLVTERVYGTSVSNKEQLVAQGFSLSNLAERGVEIFFTQVFRDGYFHADMHPGNILVALDDILHPKYIVVDFGIMGTLSSSDQRYLAENFLAFLNRDYRRVAELHVESEWVPFHTRVDEFESAIRGVCEPIFERPLKDISLGQTLLRLFQTARRFHMEIQPQLLLLQKTLINVEGLGRQLYPELDIWKTARPILNKWMRKQLGPAAFFHKLKAHSPYLLERLPELPHLFYRALYQTAYPHRRQPLASLSSITPVLPSHSLSKGVLWGLLGSAALFFGALLFKPDWIIFLIKYFNKGFM